MMDIQYQPYIDPCISSIIEGFNPPRVCIDNNTSQDSTLVKVDSIHKDGILLEMVQVLTDLDLLISKSYISSDGGWLMDVFHVTDQLGNKLVDETLLSYIEQVLCSSKRQQISKELEPKTRVAVRPPHVSDAERAIEVTGINRAGFLSEISASITDMRFLITAGVAWTHSNRLAVIMYIEDAVPGGSEDRLRELEEHLESVVEARHVAGERRGVRLTTNPTHTERRLHQMLCSDFDYEPCHGCTSGDFEHKRNCLGIHVMIQPMLDRGYLMVNIRSKDRPKLLFDTICALTDANYAVFHAAISSSGAIAEQEYYIKPKGATCETVGESGRERLAQCLIAAIERRLAGGVKLDIEAEDRMGLLADVTRAMRENGMSMTRAEFGRQRGRAVGSFYVVDSSEPEVDVSPRAIDVVKKEIGNSVVKVNGSPEGSPRSSGKEDGGSEKEKEKAQMSLAGLIWSQFERLSVNLGLLK